MFVFKIHIIWILWIFCCILCFYILFERFICGNICSFRLSLSFSFYGTENWLRALKIHSKGSSKCSIPSLFSILILEKHSTHISVILSVYLCNLIVLYLLTSWRSYLIIASPWIESKNRFQPYLNQWILCLFFKRYITEWHRRNEYMNSCHPDTFLVFTWTP